MRELRDAGARAGKATCLIKSMVFLGFMFDVDSAKVAPKSKRAQGAAFVLLAAGPAREGISPLTVPHVRALQRGVNTLPEPSGRIICGTACALISCRVRYKDMQRGEKEPCSDKAEGAPTYLEIPLTKTKTTNRTRTFFDK